MSEKTTALTYDQLSNLEKLYMFEFILPEAIRAVMAAAQITAYTNFVPAEFQQDRPRVGISFVQGAGQGRFHPTVKRECAWKGTFTLEVITPADMVAHGRFVAAVRNIMSGLVASFNETQPMQYHNFRPMIHAGAAFMHGGVSPTMKPEEGYYQTTMIFETDFAIQDDAWAALLPT